MPNPTCRELLDEITDYHSMPTRDVKTLASRVEKVLALRVTAITDPYLDGRRSMLEQVVRLLNGEKL